MASEVDIGNLAVAHLGEDATISSFDPPEGSTQAELVARFYPIARDILLEMHTWKFATKRTTLALIESTVTEWDYSYAEPNNALVIFAILPPGASDDYSAPNASPYTDYSSAEFNYAPTYQTQPFSCESGSDGQALIYTDVEDAEARYIARVTDPTKFSPLFTLALSRLIAHFIAGPILKGDVGRAESKSQYAFFLKAFADAAIADSSQSKTDVRHAVPWISGR